MFSHYFLLDNKLTQFLPAKKTIKCQVTTITHKVQWKRLTQYFHHHASVSTAASAATCIIYSDSHGLYHFISNTFKSTPSPHQGQQDNVISFQIGSPRCLNLVMNRLNPIWRCIMYLNQYHPYAWLENGKFGNVKATRKCFSIC